jgi:hypothetical protein
MKGISNRDTARWPIVTAPVWDAGAAMSTIFNAAVDTDGERCSRSQPEAAWQSGRVMNGPARKSIVDMFSVKPKSKAEVK